jgi:ABC-2 type transport system ATP-binding protein
VPVLISVRGLCKDFPGVRALDRLDLEIEAGSITALVGPNGAGKTTLLRLLSGLTAPSEGEIMIDGRSTTVDPRRVHAAVGFLPDHFGLYEDLTPRQMLNFFGRAYRLEESSIAKRASEALEQVGLSDKADEASDSLSRGMRQRLGLARALLHDPQLLLLDEPASGLDPRSRRELQEILKKHASVGRTVVVSSHILAELEEYCTNIAIMDQGRVVFSGPAGETPFRARRYRLKLHGQEPSEALLRDRPGVSNARVEEGHLVFDFGGDEAEAAELLRGLVNGGAPVSSFVEVQNTIQDRYLSMVSRRE